MEKLLVIPLDQAVCNLYGLTCDDYLTLYCLHYVDENKRVHPEKKEFCAKVGVSTHQLKRIFREMTDKQYIFQKDKDFPVVNQDFKNIFKRINKEFFQTF